MLRVGGSKGDFLGALGDVQAVLVAQLVLYAVSHHQPVHPPGCAEDLPAEHGYDRAGTGFQLEPMPSHTHERRMEIYTYFELPEGQVVFHMCGEPTQINV